MSKAKCLNCSKELESTHVHDFVSCDCRNQTFVDGGSDYMHCGGADLGLVQVIIDSDGKQTKPNKKQKEVIRFFKMLSNLEAGNSSLVTQQELSELATKVRAMHFDLLNAKNRARGYELHLKTVEEENKKIKSTRLKSVLIQAKEIKEGKYEY